MLQLPIVNVVVERISFFDFKLTFLTLIAIGEDDKGSFACGLRKLMLTEVSLKSAERLKDITFFFFCVGGVSEVGPM